MGIFDNQNGQPAPGPNLSVPPTEKIMAMRGQGLNNNQIIQNLQREGYDSDMIFKAMNQADISAGIESAPSGHNIPTEHLSNPMSMSPPASEPGNLSFPPPQNQSIPPPFEGMGQQPMPSMPPPQIEGALSAPPSEQMSIERIEEIAEAIIDEKWNEIVKSINKIIDWKDRTENKITRLEQSFLDMRKDFETLSHGILGKVGEYDKNLSNLGVEIKAMEQVFQKVLPGLSENVHALDRIAKQFKNEENENK